MLLAAWAVSLLVVVFLILLDLRGTLRDWIDAVLSLLWLGLLFVGFWFFSWQIGLAGFFGSFVAGVLMKPLFVDRINRRFHSHCALANRNRNPRT